MQVALPDRDVPVKVLYDSEDKLSREAYVAFCKANPDLRIERSVDGEIVIVSSAGAESDYRSLEVAADLRKWVKKDRRGVTFSSSLQFFLPDGSGACPDASWLSCESLNKLTKEERKEFLALAPEFVVEVLSPSDRLKKAQTKME
jgi:Uma2 family endonuclease